MSNNYKDNMPISAKDFMGELRRYQKGSVSRRHFLGVTGLGLATAVMANAMPWLKPRKAYAFGELGDTLVFSTWPNYHDPANLERFTELTGVDVLVNVFTKNRIFLGEHTEYLIATEGFGDVLVLSPKFIESRQGSFSPGEAVTVGWKNETALALEDS